MGKGKEGNVVPFFPFFAFLRVELLGPRGGGFCILRKHLSCWR